MRVDGVEYSLGYFDTAEEANEAAISGRIRLMTNNLLDRELTTAKVNVTVDTAREIF